MAKDIIHEPVKNYAHLVKQGLMAYVNLVEKFPHPTYNLALAFDDIHQHYLVRKLGWKNNSRVNYTVLHVALHNGKIWIEEDMTEDGIATYFLEQGVPREDIVLAFHPPSMRPLTEFAVA